MSSAGYSAWDNKELTDWDLTLSLSHETIIEFFQKINKKLKYGEKSTKIILTWKCLSFAQNITANELWYLFSYEFALSK